MVMETIKPVRLFGARFSLGELIVNGDRTNPTHSKTRNEWGTQPLQTLDLRYFSHGVIRGSSESW